MNLDEPNNTHCIYQKIFPSANLHNAHKTRILPYYMSHKAACNVLGSGRQYPFRQLFHKEYDDLFGDNGVNP